MMQSSLSENLSSNLNAWDKTSISWEDYCVPIEVEIIEQLRDLVEIPFENYSELHKNYDIGRIKQFTDEMRSKYLDAFPGYILLKGLDTLTKSQWQTAVQVISSCLGDIYLQHSDGTKIRTVHDRGTRIGEGQQARYSDSRFGGSMHTDGAQAPLPVPDYFTLFCANKASKGGKFRMVDANKVYQILAKETPDILEILTQPFHFDRRGDVGEDKKPTTLKPIFFFEENQICCTYLRDYIEIGHSYPYIPQLTPSQIEAFDRLDSLLENPALQISGYMNRSELILINNKRIIHGRTTFQDSVNQKRLLWRIWLYKSIPLDELRH